MELPIQLPKLVVSSHIWLRFLAHWACSVSDRLSHPSILKGFQSCIQILGIGQGASRVLFYYIQRTVWCWRSNQGLPHARHEA